MKSVASIKSKTDSPKTPGGISKALLTPCRRVGLSRNWRKSGPSPFNSPLSSSEIKQDVTTIEKKTRKRKDVCEDTENSQKDKNEIEITPPTIEVSTPIRNVELPRRKRSKTLLSTLNNTSENEDNISEQTKDGQNNKIDSIIEQNITNIEETAEISVKEPVSTPVRLKSKSKSKKKSPSAKKIVNETSESTNKNNVETSESANKIISSKIEDTTDKRSKVKSPNNLTKECIVVIQKKIFKDELISKETEDKQPNKTSQTLFDSDSDDIPLCQINKEENQPIVIEDDDDFETIKTTKKLETSKKLTLTTNLKKANTKTKIETETVNLRNQNDDDEKHQKEPPTSKIKKTISKTQSYQNSDDENNKKLSKLKKETISKPNVTTSKTQNVENKTQNSQNTDDDDDFVEKKRTIVIKRTYDKMAKPIKAKSTGSITQKDIDELKLRIEKKKKLLLAKAMTEDTKELRDLIKKWQKGCQDALMELMNLMKTKMPEKNMDYSEMLKALKIPANLVGYDSENDNFCTPNDGSIILDNLGG